MKHVVFECVCTTKICCEFEKRKTKQNENFLFCIAFVLPRQVSVESFECEQNTGNSMRFLKRKTFFFFVFVLQISSLFDRYYYYEQCMLINLTLVLFLFLSLLALAIHTLFALVGDSVWCLALWCARKLQ